MKIVVQKYGGSSVKNIEMLEHVCYKIKEKIDKGYRVVAVVSAQGKTTDMLLKKSKEYGGRKNSQELDMLLATGELSSAALLTMFLNNKKINAVAFSGGDCGIITDSTYGAANIKGIYPEKIIKELENNNVVVACGFQGVDKNGYITTLGRGGSDLTATSLAKVLKAEICEIYSDIDGIYTADPRQIENAKLLPEISFNEMLELSSAGAKVMHSGSVRAFKDSKGKLYIKNTSKKENKGTEVIDSYDIPNMQVKITKKDNISKITIVGEGYISKPKQVEKITKILSENNIDVYMIQISEISVSILLDTESSLDLIKILHNKFNE